jgi:hypothetical protein
MTAINKLDECRHQYFFWTTVITTATAFIKSFAAGGVTLNKKLNDGCIRTRGAE